MSWKYCKLLNNNFKSLKRVIANVHFPLCRIEFFEASIFPISISTQKRSLSWQDIMSFKAEISLVRTRLHQMLRHVP